MEYRALCCITCCTLQFANNNAVKNWRGAGAVERARLESECTPCGYRGFESPPLRLMQNFPNADLFHNRLFYNHYSTTTAPEFAIFFIKFKTSSAFCAL